MKYLVALPPISNEIFSIAMNVKYVKYLKLVDISHNSIHSCLFYHEKVQVGKDQEKAQSEKDSHSKNRGGKKPN